MLYYEKVIQTRYANIILIVRSQGYEPLEIIYLPTSNEAAKSTVVNSEGIDMKLIIEKQCY